MGKPYQFWTEDQKQSNIERNKMWKRTPIGVLHHIYRQQKKSSITRGHPPPAYTVSDLYERYLNDQSFLLLHQRWVEIGFNRYLKPSLDRIDASQPYTLGNLQLMTWRENLTKARSESARTEVVMFEQDGTKVQTFDSIRAAAYATGVSAGNICACCMGMRITAGGKVWKYGAVKKYDRTRSYTPRPKLGNPRTMFKKECLSFWSQHPEMSATEAAGSLGNVKATDLYKWRRSAKTWRDERRPNPYAQA